MAYLRDDKGGRQLWWVRPLSYHNGYKPFTFCKLQALCSKCRMSKQGQLLIFIGLKFNFIEFQDWGRHESGKIWDERLCECVDRLGGLSSWANIQKCEVFLKLYNKTSCKFSSPHPVSSAFLTEGRLLIKKTPAWNLSSWNMLQFQWRTTFMRSFKLVYCSVLFMSCI